MIAQTERKYSRFLKWCRFTATAYFVFTLYALFSPNPREIVPIPSFSVIHAAAFFVLGFLSELARGRFSFVVLSVLLLLYGPVSECVQPLTGRCFEWMDIIEDIIGVLLGIPAAYSLKPLIKKLCLKRRFGEKFAENEPGRGSGKDA